MYFSKKQYLQINIIYKDYKGNTQPIMKQTYKFTQKILPSKENREKITTIHESKMLYKFILFVHTFKHLKCILLFLFTITKK